MKRIQRLTRTVAVVAGLAAIVTFLIVGAVFHWAWAGFDKPLYDWLQLLIIPVVLTLVAVWFNRIDKKNELAIASDNQREAALQSYLDRISELLLEKHLREAKPNDENYDENAHEVRMVARGRTLTMLYQLDTRRTNYMLTFLRDTHLIDADPRKTVITFALADFRNMNLQGIDFIYTDLRGTSFESANLSGANFYGSNLIMANLSGADLSKAILYEANLTGADLSKANLTNAVIDKPSLDKVTVTKEQIAVMRVVSS